MLIEDLVVLGRACPEPISDGRITVCMAGWADSLGFVRLYPTRHDMRFKQWDILKVDVERNANDTRYESWKISGSRSDWEILPNKVQVVGHVSSPTERRNLIGNLTDQCVSTINSELRSLGIVKPTILKAYFASNPNYGKLFQLGLPGFSEHQDIKIKRDFEFEPRITYRCPECQTASLQHDQQVLEWGFYEWVRKNPDKKEQVWENARIRDPGSDIYLLVGNQAKYRTSFMIISVLRVPKGDVASPMFPYRKLPPPDLLPPQT